MKKVISLARLFFIIAIVLFSCTKEEVDKTNYLEQLLNELNRLPVANAGGDFVVNYDLQSCTSSTIDLNGAASYDPDGTLASYEWSGPGAIFNPGSAVTRVNSLPPGEYRFVLKVKDSKGIVDDDDVIVRVESSMNRPQVNAQLIPVGILSEERANLAIGTSANKIVFAGGSSPNKRVDIYNTITNAWSTAELSVARWDIGVTTIGNKIFFAGGKIETPHHYDWVFPDVTSMVDVYDAANNTWSVMQLSEARGGVAAVSLGNKAFFAGGVNEYDMPFYRIDIYDVSTNSWTIASLSEARSQLSAEAVNNKIYFAGGYTVGLNGFYTPSERVDIYDTNSGSISTINMGEARYQMKSVAIGNKIFWAGGIAGQFNVVYPTSKVEIYDIGTQSSSIGCLSQSKAWMADARVVVRNNTLVFYPGRNNKFDIYDIATGSWSIGVLNQSIQLQEPTLISVNNTIYVAGGLLNGSLSNVVWKLEF